MRWVSLHRDRRREKWIELNQISCVISMKLARTQRTEKMYVNTTSENYNEHLICVFSVSSLQFVESSTSSNYWIMKDNNGKQTVWILMIFLHHSFSQFFFPFSFLVIFFSSFVLRFFFLGVREFCGFDHIFGRTEEINSGIFPTWRLNARVAKCWC